MILFNHKIIPSKIKLLAFALAENNKRNSQYEINFGIERSSCESNEEAKRKQAILDNAVLNRGEILPLVGVIGIVDKNTKNSIEVAYNSSSRNQSILFLEPEHFFDESDEYEKLLKRNRLFSFLNKLLYNPSKAESLQELNYIKNTTASALAQVLPYELGLGVGSFLSRKDAALLAATCRQAAGLKEKEEKSEAAAAVNSQPLKFQN
ncbi:MAG TPA: hypothetical protein VLH77_04075 [Gammaproteobacteria bacterium]|nr:hypothetical protein [Gammaproteobacteria bacterium]